MGNSGGQLYASERWYASLAATLLGALTFVFGLQFLRLLTVALSVNLVQINQLNSILVAIMGLAIFGIGFLAPSAHALFGRFKVAVILGGLDLLRIAEQLSPSLINLRCYLFPRLDSLTHSLWLALLETASPGRPTFPKNALTTSGQAQIS